MNILPNDTNPQTAVHQALTCPYRRQVLENLVIREDNVATVEELITELLDQDRASGNRKHIAVKLHHVALPKLADFGFIEYDARSRTVRYRESPVLEQELRRSTDMTSLA
ncbi:hypothetical protein ACLI4R_10515 [Natrialbaceae archaeon A-chndr2]